MKIALCFIGLLALGLTACNKNENHPLNKESESSITQTNIKIDPKAAAPIATDVRTLPFDPKTGKPIASEKK